MRRNLMLNLLVSLKFSLQVKLLILKYLVGQLFVNFTLDSLVIRKIILRQDVVVECFYLCERICELRDLCERVSFWHNLWFIYHCL